MHKSTWRVRQSAKSVHKLINAQEESERAQVTANLGRYGLEILAALANSPLNRADVLAAIGLKSSYPTYQRHVVPLINQGLVGMTNSDNPTARTQAYALTGLGRSVLALMQKPDQDGSIPVSEGEPSVG